MEQVWLAHFQQLLRAQGVKAENTLSAHVAAVRVTFKRAPANLGLEADLFRQQARDLADDQIRKKMTEIDDEARKTLQSKRQAEGKLNALESEKEALEYKLQEIKNKLHELEIMDPAKIGIKLQKLREWEGLNHKNLKI
jgi:septal ring factor EnvC (AmiA/AmiB activator)